MSNISILCAKMSIMITFHFQGYREKSVFLTLIQSFSGITCMWALLANCWNNILMFITLQSMSLGPRKYSSIQTTGHNFIIVFLPPRKFCHVLESNDTFKYNFMSFLEFPLVCYSYKNGNKYWQTIISLFIFAS